MRPEGVELPCMAVQNSILANDNLLLWKTRPPCDKVRFICRTPQHRSTAESRSCYFGGYALATDNFSDILQYQKWQSFTTYHSFTSGFCAYMSVLATTMGMYCTYSRLETHNPHALLANQARPKNDHSEFLRLCVPMAPSLSTGSRL